MYNSNAMDKVMSESLSCPDGFPMCSFKYKETERKEKCSFLHTKIIIIIIIIILFPR